MGRRFPVLLSALFALLWCMFHSCFDLFVSKEKLQARSFWLRRQSSPPWLLHLLLAPQIPIVDLLLVGFVMSTNVRTHSPPKKFKINQQYQDLFLSIVYL